MSDETSDTPDTAPEPTEDAFAPSDGGQADGSFPPRDWEAFTFHQEKLKHLTSVGLFLAGGFITLFQLEVIDLQPVHIPALVMVVLSSMISVTFEAALGNTVNNEFDPIDKSRDRFGVPKSVQWAEIGILALLGGAIGYMGFFFLHSMEMV